MRKNEATFTSDVRTLATGVYGEFRRSTGRRPERFCTTCHEEVKEWCGTAVLYPATGQVRFKGFIHPACYTGRAPSVHKVDNSENNILAMLTFANKRMGAYVSASSFASMCNIALQTVWNYLSETPDRVHQVAEHWEYDIRIALQGGRHLFMAAVHRGWGNV